MQIYFYGHAQYTYTNSTAFPWSYIKLQNLMKCNKLTLSKT